MQKPIIVGTFYHAGDHHEVRVTPLPECLKQYVKHPYLVISTFRQRLIVLEEHAANVLFMVMSGDSQISTAFVMTPMQFILWHGGELPPEWLDDESLKEPVPAIVDIHLNLRFDHLTPEMEGVLHAMTKGDVDVVVLSHDGFFKNPRWLTFLQGNGLLKVNSVDKHYLDLRGQVDNSDGLLNQFLDWVMPFTIQKHGSKLVGLVGNRAVYRTFDGWIGESL